MVPPRVHARPSLSVILVALVVLVAACSTGGAEPPSSTRGDAPTASATGTTPTPPTARSSTSATSRSTSTTTPSTSVAPTSSTVPADPVVAETCATLATAGYVTRSERVAALDTATLAAVEAACPADLGRVRAAQEIERRAVVVASYSVDAMLSELRCEDGRFSFTFTNRTPETVGGNFVVYLWPPEGGAAIGSSAGPLVVWSLAPGAAVELAGDYPEPPVAFDDCGVRGDVFLADPTPADAGLAAPRNAALTGEDTAAWLLALYRAEHQLSVGVDRDAAGDVEDLRSPAWLRILAESSMPMVSRDVATVEVCAVERPDPDHVAVLHRLLVVAGQTQVDGKVRARGNDQLLSVGVFRRGSDGQWRWLGTSQYVALEAAGDCPQRDAGG